MTGLFSRLSRCGEAAVEKIRDWFADPPGTVDKDALPFQNDIGVITEAQPPALLQRTLMILASFCGLLLVIAIVFDTEIVVTGPGRLTTSSPPIVLQPLERALVRNIAVKSGDRVHKGQVLATLDPTFSQADVSQLTTQQRSELALINRLDAELAGKPYQISNPADREQQLQFTLFQQRRDQYRSRLRAYDEEINRLKATIQTADADRQSLLRQLDIARQVMKMRETLLESQAGSKLNYLDSQNLVARVERDLQSTANHRVESLYAQASKEAERQAFISEWQRQTLEDLYKARQDTAKTGESLVKATRMHDLVEIVAPEDAIVVDVAKRSQGSVAREAEALITLVRADDPLSAEVEIASADIGYAKPGDPVKLKVDAFPYQRHGMLEGVLHSITQESTSPAESQQQDGSTPSPRRAAMGATHHAYIDLTHTDLTALPEGTSLIPGMTLSAEIKVGSRSVISYFLFPVIRGFGESIREP